MNGCLRLFRAGGFPRARLGGGIVHLSAERRKTKAAEDEGKLGHEIGERHVAHRPHPHSGKCCGYAEDLGAVAPGEAAGDEPSESVHGEESRSRKSAQDDKWSFCLTAGTLCPSYQERP